jgi:O-antigen/teichoic acid export membrane protein
VTARLHAPGVTGFRTHQRSSLPRATMLLGVAHVVGQGLAVVTAVLLARRLGAAGFGTYAVTLGVVHVANVGTTFGTDMALIRAIARDGRLDRCSAALGAQLVLSLGAIATLVAGALGVGALRGEGAGIAAPLGLYATSLLPAAVFSVSTATLRGLGMVRSYAGTVVAAAATPLALVAAFVRGGDSATRTVGVLLGAQFVIAVVAALCCAPALRAGRVRIVPRSGEVVSMIRASRSIGLLGMIGALYQRVALLGVSVMVGSTRAGWYSGAARVVESSKVGHLALGSAVFPMMAQAEGAGTVDATRHRRERQVIGRSWTACIVLGLAVSIGLFVVAPTLVDRLYGREFTPTTSGLRVLALGVVPSTIITFRSLRLVAQEREGEVMRAMVRCLAVLVLAATVLIPAVGWVGACWAMVIADAAGAAILVARPTRRSGLAMAVIGPDR